VLGASWLEVAGQLWSRPLVNLASRITPDETPPVQAAPVEAAAVDPNTTAPEPTSEIVSASLPLVSTLVRGADARLTSSAPNALGRAGGPSRRPPPAPPTPPTPAPERPRETPAAAVNDMPGRSADPAPGVSVPVSTGPLPQLSAAVPVPVPTPPPPAA